MPLDLAGTPFQRKVWEQLLQVPYGATTSYGLLAQAAGAGHAVRAVGTAIGRNPLSIIIPCHRIVAGNGALAGYAGGLERKRSLLALEAAGSNERNGSLTAHRTGAGAHATSGAAHAAGRRCRIGVDRRAGSALGAWHG